MAEFADAGKAVAALRNPATSAADLADIVEWQPGLWSRVACHPAVYAELLHYLDVHGDATVKSAVAARLAGRPWREPSILRPAWYKGKLPLWAVLVIVVTVTTIGAIAWWWELNHPTLPSNPDVELVWVHTLNSESLDGFTALAAIGDDTVVVGYYSSFDSPGVPPTQGWDAVIARYSANGGLAWLHTFGGGGIDRFTAVAQIDDGVVAVGYMDCLDGGAYTFSPRGGCDGVVARYDMNGELVWSSRFGGSDNDFLYGVAAVDDGIIAVGSSESSDYDLLLADELDDDSQVAVIAHYNLDGRLSWLRTFSAGSWGDIFTSVTTVDGGIVVTDGSYLVMYDLNGNLVWTRTESGRTYYAATAVDGGIIVAGTDTAGLHLGTDRRTDALIAKYDFAGNPLWVQTLGCGGENSFSAVAAVGDGAIAVGGSSCGDVEIRDGYGDSNALIAYYGFDGTLTWVETLDYPGHNAWSSTVATAGGLVVAGASDAISSWGGSIYHPTIALYRGIGG